MKKKILSLVFLLTVIVFPKEVLAVENPSIGVSLYKCDPTVETDIWDGAYACQNKLIEGTLTEISTGDVLEAGTKVMAVLYLNLNSVTNINGYQTQLDFDSNIFNPILDDGRLVYLDALVEDLPNYVKRVGTQKITVTDWKHQSNLYGEGHFLYISNDSNINPTSLQNDVNFLYAFFEVSNSATIGASAYLNVNQSETFGIANKTEVPITAVSTNYVVRNASTELISLTPSVGSIDYSNNKTDYEIMLPGNINSISFDYVLSDPNATAIGTNSTELTDNLTNITIIVTGVDGKTRVITVKVLNNKIMSSNLSVERISEDKCNFDTCEDIVIGEEPRIALSTFLAKFDNNSQYLHIYDKDGNEITDMNTYIGSFMTVKLIINGIEYDRVTVVIRGDFNGDGEVTISDETILNRIVLRFRDNSYLHLKIGDIDNSNRLTVLDKTLVSMFLLHGIDSLN